MTKIKILIYLLSATSILHSSCKKFNEEEPIPSYIRIPKCTLSCDSILQGSTRSNISDVWVNINENRQGTYEVPVNFPVVENGNKRITLRAGIKANGIASSRIIYPFYNAINIDTVLTPENQLVFNPVFTYLSSSVFAWLENFQGNGFSLDRGTLSDTLLNLESDSINTNQKYGVFYIDAIRQKFEYKSTEKFVLPSNGSNIFLELDYQCTHPFLVGVYINKLQQSVKTPIIYINPHANSFNHIYIDLTYIVSQNSDAINYNIFFGSSLYTDEYTKGEIKIDNIKLIHF